MKLGLYGGSFDPVHRGHLEAAQRALEDLGLDRLLWVVAGRPPHKLNRTLTPAVHRLRMLELALAGRPCMDVCESELLRPDPTYTIDTLRAFQELLPRASLVFLIGADSLLDLPHWKEPREILRYQVVAVPRPGFEVSRVSPSLRRRVRVLRGPHAPVASSQVRARLGAGAGVRGMLPAAVEAYIRMHRLYGAWASARA